MKVRRGMGRAVIAWSLMLGLPLGLAAQDPALKVAGTDVPVPKRTKFISPVYPPAAQAQGLRGIVILELVIDEEGRVAQVDVVRSVPPFDEAATFAVKQWEYEVTKVDGRPVRVRHTLPVTFALKLPPMDRQEGVPELRQGASASVPASTERNVLVKADVTLQRDGSVADAVITEGEPPFSETLLRTIRTWRFAPDEEEGTVVSFRVEAEFVPGRGGAPGRVDLKLREPRRTKAAAAREATPAATAQSATGSASPSPGASGVEALSSPAPPAAPPATTAAPAVEIIAARPAPPPGVPGSPGAPGPTGPPSATAGPESVAPAPVAQGSDTPTAGTPAVAAQPPPAPFSAVRDVVLGADVPDLAKGRRPVVPPLARMAGAAGTVEIQMAVDAAGAVSVQNVAGPEVLKEAARQTAASWGFRRTTADRLYLVATFTYAGDQAKVEVRRAQ